MLESPFPNSHSLRFWGESAWYSFGALLLAFDVLFPRRYRFSRQSARDIQEMHRSVVKAKFFLLRLSIALYLLALVLLSLAAFLP